MLLSSGVLRLFKENIYSPLSAVTEVTVLKQAQPWNVWQVRRELGPLSGEEMAQALEPQPVVIE